MYPFHCLSFFITHHSLHIERTSHNEKKTSPEVKKELFKNFSFVVKLIWQTSPQFLLVKLLVTLVQTISPFILIVFPKFIVDAIVEQRSWSHVLLLILSMCGCYLFMMIISAFASTYVEKHSDLIQFDLVRTYGKKVMGLNYEDLENPAILDMFEKSKSGFDLYGFFDKVVSVVSNFLSLIGYAVILFTYSWLMLTIVFGVVVINLFCNKQKSKYYYQMREESAPINRKFLYLSNLMLGFDYAKEIKVNQLNNYICDKYDSNLSVFNKILTKIYRKLLMLTGISSFTSLLQMLALYTSVAYSALSGSITIGDFSMYISSITAASNCLLGIVTSFIDVNQNMKYATDMRLFFEIERKSEKRDSAAKIAKDHFELSFNNVSFRYPGTDNWVLRNLSFCVKNGEKISVVGKNGSGKTTLIKLLLRLYEPTEGEILFNGKNISSYDYSEYMNMFAPVLQDFKIFAFSCKENVVFDLPYNEKKLYKALRDSGLEEKLKNLPYGVDTSIYKLFDENGVEFSGGENQKLAIARAMYKDSPIILLDEPTANLDPIAEYDIYMMIYKMLENKTAFFVSHRLASCRFCDRIFVISEGQLIADGNHTELINCCPIYKEMFNKQAQFYVND